MASFEALQDTNLLSLDYEHIPVIKGDIYIQKFESNYVSPDGKYVDKNSIINNPIWRKISTDVTLVEDGVLSVETTKKWKIELCFEANTEDAIKVKDLLQNTLNNNDILKKQ